MNYRSLCKRQTFTRARKLRKNQTLYEKKLWALIRNNKLGIKARRQVIFRGYIVDFYFPKIKLAIELDGFHHQTKAVAAHDLKRDKVIRDLGITIVRFNNNASLFNVVEEILRIAKAF